MPGLLITLGKYAAIVQAIIRPDPVADDHSVRFAQGADQPGRIPCGGNQAEPRGGLSLPAQPRRSTATVR